MTGKAKGFRCSMCGKDHETLRQLEKCEQDKKAGAEAKVRGGLNQ